eukprot:c26889_g1_i2 orf=877-2010(+)
MKISEHASKADEITGIDDACHLKVAQTDSGRSPFTLDATPYKQSCSSMVHLKKISCPKRGLRQYFLDLGQSDFSYTTCQICGLLYACGQEDDEKLHATFHKNCLVGIRFKVKEVAVLMENDMGLAPGWLLDGQWKAYLFISSSKKVVGCLVVETIKEAYPILPATKDFVRCEMLLDNNTIQAGYSGKEGDLLGQQVKRCLESESKSLSNHEGRSTNYSGFLPKSEAGKQADLGEPFSGRTDKLVNNIDNCGSGNTIANKPSSKTMIFGNVKFEREIHKKKSSCQFERNFGDLNGAIMCSNVSVPAVCGIKGIWVSRLERRKGIATKLLDAMRSSFSFGFVLQPLQCAFSQPTVDGKALAVNYCKTEGFLVYSQTPQP